jgi:4-diphosphocytidyl-2-C-methyl-D-erythritol kinase
LKARAKINLGLDVTGKREDGYHLVRMVMQSLKLYDRLEMCVISEPEIRIRANLPFIPTDQTNLIWKAADLLRREFRIEEGISVDLNKRIPVAAGLAGGSADAAAALVGMNRLFHLRLSGEELMNRGVKIGADVPYCIMRGTALSEGIGEKLTELPPLPHCWILVAKPGISVSTKGVYIRLDEQKGWEHPDIDGMVRALEEGSLEGVTERLGNVLELVTVPEYPVIAKIKQTMMEKGAEGALMSGSGPTVYGIFREEAQARIACSAVRKSGAARQIYVTEPFQNRRTDA